MSLGLQASEAPTKTPYSSLVVLSVGLGLYLAWQTVNISPSLFPQPHESVWNLINTWYYPETIIFMMLLAVFAFWSYKTGSLLKHRWLVLLTTFVVVLSTALTYLCGWVFPDFGAAGVIAGTLLSAAKAGFTVLWGEALCQTRFKHILLCVSGAYAMTFSLCLLVANLNPNAALIFHALLPLLSGFLLLIMRDEASFPVVRTGKTPILSLPYRLFLGIGIFGAVIVLTNNLSETKALESAELFTLIAGLAISLIVFVVAKLYTKEFDFSVVYRLITPLLIGCLLLVLLLESGQQQYEAFVIGLTWVFFRIFTWTMWGNIASRSRIPAACIFAVGQITLSLCSTIAELFSQYLMPRGISIPLMVSVIIFLTVVTSGLLLNESDIRRFFEKKRVSEPTENETAAYESCVALAAEEYSLSSREQEIILLVLQGKNNAVIERTIVVASSTLRTHLRNIYSKTTVHSREELVELMKSYLAD